MNTCVRTGRHPFQFALLVTALIAGLAGIVLPSPGPSENITVYLGPLAPWLYTCLVVAALFGLTGTLWPVRDVRHLQFALLIERAGMPLLAGSASVYALISVAASGLTALLAASAFAGIALAALIRTRQITADLKFIRAVEKRADRAAADRAAEQTAADTSTTEPSEPSGPPVDEGERGA